MSTNKSLSDLLKKSATKKHKPLIKGSAQTLRGSGITKRKAEQAERDIEKQQQKVYEFAKEHDEEIHSVLDLEIASSLMDDSITLDEYQLKAVNGLEFQKYGCLIGQAGVGKTTTVKAVLNKILPLIPTIDLNQNRLESFQSGSKNLNIAVAFVSFMGKAVQQIKRALPEEYHPLCETMHSTLGYAPEFVEKTYENGQTYQVKQFKPQFTKYNKLNLKLVIIDEAGSVPIYLFNELVEALPDDCRIILIGDLNQLPPVTGRSVLGFAITKWPTFVLDKIHRQSAENPIIANADLIIHGRRPIRDDKKFMIMDLPDSGFKAFTKTCAVIQALHKKGLFNPLEDAFIVPQNKDSLGQVAFNEKLVRYFNPTKELDGVPINPPVVITAGYHHHTFAVGDKVMITSNDREKGLTNGMIGVIESIAPNQRFKGEAIAEQMMTNLQSDDLIDLSNLRDEIKEQENVKDEVEESERQASHTTVIKFQNVEESVSFEAAGAYQKIQHAYCMTGHKSQGSEYPTVVIVVHSANLIMLTREWLYTVTTRAKERVILLCNQRGITKAVNRQLLKGKTIEEKAQQFIKLSGKEDTALPELAEPETLLKLVKQ
ncbi:MAG TPA: hypothetical protein ENJ28_04990 [Gammaproteobacteria bacterium]|nr:hypothetical protein [Gammaproteobacteria bacterium]